MCIQLLHIKGKDIKNEGYDMLPEEEELKKDKKENDMKLDLVLCVDCIN